MADDGFGRTLNIRLSRHSGRNVIQSCCLLRATATTPFTSRYALLANRCSPFLRALLIRNSQRLGRPMSPKSQQPFVRVTSEGHSGPPRPGHGEPAHAGAVRVSVIPSQQARTEGTTCRPNAHPNSTDGHRAGRPPCWWRCWPGCSGPAADPARSGWQG